MTAPMGQTRFDGDYRLVPLTGGAFAIINANDWPLVSPHTWFLNGSGKSELLYAVTRIDGVRVPLHRLLMEPPEGQMVDHINRMTLDNRRANLRFCTHKENMRNTKGRPRKVFVGRQFKGVTLNRKSGRQCAPNGYRATITVDGKQRWLGAFRTQEEAARAYDEAAKTYFGAFAHLNFPSEEMAA